jgi:adenosine deaminase
MTLKDHIKNGNMIKAVIKKNKRLNIFIISYDKDNYIATDLKTNEQQKINDIDKFLKQVEIWKQI